MINLYFESAFYLNRVINCNDAATFRIYALFAENFKKKISLPTFEFEQKFQKK